MNRSGWLTWSVLAICLGGSALRSGAQGLSAPEFPVEAYKKNDKGIVVAEVSFAGDGKVSACAIVRSNAPYPLEAATVDYIKRKWIDEFFAGETLLFPITYEELPWYATHWNEDMVPPQNLLPQGDPGRTLKLRIAFGQDSWVDHVKIIQPSGIELLDQQTAIWVKVHWHNEAFAGQTLDTPFIFKTPPALTKNAPPVPSAKHKKAAPAPAAPAEPAEPAPTPAVRVE